MEARLADLQISVLKTWVPFYGWAEAVLPSEEGWVGVKRKVMLEKGKRGVELKGPSSSDEPQKRAKFKGSLKRKLH